MKENYFKTKFRHAGIVINVNVTICFKFKLQLKCRNNKNYSYNCKFPYRFILKDTITYIKL